MTAKSQQHQTVFILVISYALVILERKTIGLQRMERHARCCKHDQEVAVEVSRTRGKGGRQTNMVTQKLRWGKWDDNIIAFADQQW